MNSKSFVTLITRDRQLLRIFSGMVLSAVVMVSLAVTAGLMYL